MKIDGIQHKGIHSEKELEDIIYSIVTVVNRYDYSGCTSYRLCKEMKTNVYMLNPLLEEAVDRGYLGEKMIDLPTSKRKIYVVTMKGADMINKHLSPEEKKILRSEEEQKKIDMIEKLFE